MRRRLLIALLGIATLAIAAFAIPLALTERARISRGADGDLQKDAQRIAGLLPADFATRKASLRLPAPDPDLIGAVYDDQARLVVGRGPKLADALVRDALDSIGGFANTGGYRVRAEPSVEGEFIVGAVRVAEPLKEIDDKLRHRLFVLAAQAVAVLVIAGIAALAGARRLARPITQLHDASVRLGNGDFTVHVPHSGVAELDQSADALNAAAARLGKLLDRERAFSADVSHQLRTPITSLRATLESEQIAPRPDPRVVLQEALAEVDRLETTVGHLLALTRDVPADRQRLPIGEILDLLRHRSVSRLADDGRALRVVTPAAGQLEVVVHASRSAVEQILEVLVANARQHGKGDITVRAVESAGQGLAITVHDDGPGVLGDPAAIFKRRVGSADGHGIGLALASTLAHAEGGHLGLDAPGPGPTFRLTLPPHHGPS